MDRPIRLLLVDDHEVVRRGLKALLTDAPGIEVVGEADSVQTAVSRAASLTPDVVLLDVRLPDGSGVEACRDIRSARPETHVLMLTSYSDDNALFASIMAGASGYLLKEIRGNDLIQGIRDVAQGRSLLDPATTARVLRRLRGEETSEEEKLAATLTSQETRILALIADGLTNRQIGEKLCLAEHTVKNYVSNLLQKLGMSRRSEAAALAARLAEQRRRRSG